MSHAGLAFLISVTLLQCGAHAAELPIKPVMPKAKRKAPGQPFSPQLADQDDLTIRTYLRRKIREGYRESLNALSMSPSNIKKEMSKFSLNGVEQKRVEIIMGSLMPQERGHIVRHVRARERQDWRSAEKKRPMFELLPSKRIKQQ